MYQPQTTGTMTGLRITLTDGGYVVTYGGAFLFTARTRKEAIDKYRKYKHKRSS